ncbi:hypothetical protein TSUD_170000 [Trifolium subterraneum]|uniref:Uncharacterized protein n=1 Tax=Trifolium subterraneum TaxID=3900 RepID=A0A2Z6PBQ0_TRISU|nr:hypothetical protein TSUD_170000 [Trifolium subterraneum]
MVDQEEWKEIEENGGRVEGRTSEFSLRMFFKGLSIIGIENSTSRFQVLEFNNQHCVTKDGAMKWVHVKYEGLILNKSQPIV